MKKYLTEKLVNGRRFGFDCYGNSWEEAQANADLLGLGKVVGEHIATFDSREDARDFWDSIGGEGESP